MWARIINDEAIDVFEADPAGLFTPDLVFEEIGEGVVAGSRRALDENGNTIWLPPVAAPVTRVDPPPAAPVTYGRIVTRLAFLGRVTDAEAIAIDLASIGNTVQAATLRRAQVKISAAEEIQLDNPDTRAGVLALEAAGLLAAGRAAVILDSAVQAHEVPARYRALYYLPEVPVV